MGSRLKGKKNKLAQASPTPWLKLSIYALIVLMSLGLLWYFWLSEEGWRIAREHRAQSPASAGKGGP